MHLLGGMDPNLFHLDWDRTGEALAAIVVLAFFLERALAIVFEHRVFIKKFDKKGAKEVIAFVVAFLICLFWDFDAVSIVILADNTNLFGYIITAGVIAGGSKGAVKLFRDVMGWQSSAQAEMTKIRKDKAANAPLALRRRFWAAADAKLAGSGIKLSDDCRAKLDGLIDKGTARVFADTATDEKVTADAIPALEAVVQRIIDSTKAATKKTAGVDAFGIAVSAELPWPFA